jgi:hypothetical protein
MGRTDYPQRGYLQPHKSSAEAAETYARLIWRRRQRRSVVGGKTKLWLSGRALPLAVRIDPTAEVANVKGGEALCPGGKENRSR